MRKNNLKVEKFLDGEKLFKYYYETMGSARSCQKLVEWCKSQGMVNSKDKPPTRMGVWLSMWRWAIRSENQDIAKNIYGHSDFGDVKLENISDNDWMKVLKSRAYTSLYSGDAYERWCKENGVKV